MLCCRIVFYLVLIIKHVCTDHATTKGNLSYSEEDPSLADSGQNFTKTGARIQENSEYTASGRIIGGTKCFVEDHPWIVSLRSSSRLSHFCGGSMIGLRWVLSAAHCIETLHRRPREVTAMVGLSTLRRRSAQAIVVKRIFMHDSYSTKTYINDIALLVLDHNVILHLPTIGFIKIPEKPFRTDLTGICPTFTVAGWGSQQAYSSDEPQPPYKSSPHLLCVEVPFITPRECQKYSSLARDSLICTFTAKGGKDSCQGDSGGPLTCRGMQFGIVSWGYGCGAPYAPAFYTRVDRYLDFINETTKNYRDASSCIKVNCYLITIVVFRIFAQC